MVLQLVMGPFPTFQQINLVKTIHTLRAILTQDAKYKFVPVNENQERRDTRNQNNQSTR